MPNIVKMNASSIYVFDLETAIMASGQKRGNTIILSIGAVNLINKKTFHCYVRHKINEKVKEAATMSIRKKIKYKESEAVPISVALQNFFDYLGEDPLLIAHNGNSFDFKIVNGAISNNNLPLSFTGLDSYHYIIKKTFSLPSYKLSNVYYCLLGDTNLKWHTAVDDSLGLREIILKCVLAYIEANATLAYRALYKKINCLYGTEFDSSMFLCEKSKRLISEICNEISMDKHKTVYELLITYCINSWANKNIITYK